MAYMVLTPVVTVVVSWSRLRPTGEQYRHRPRLSTHKGRIRCEIVAYLRRKRRRDNGIKYFLDFFVGRERDIVDNWEVGKSRSVWPLGGLSGLSQAVVV